MQSKDVVGFNTLPNELIFAILLFLSPKHIVKLATVSKLFAAITCNDYLWKKQSEKYFSTIIKMQEGISCQQFFRKQHEENYKNVKLIVKKLCSVVINEDELFLAELEKQYAISLDDLKGDGYAFLSSPLKIAQKWRRQTLLNHFYRILTYKKPSLVRILTSPLIRKKSLFQKLQKKALEENRLQDLRSAILCHQPVEKILSEILELNKKNLDLNSALHLSAKSNHYALVHVLLKQGADIENTDNYNGSTPLYTACQEGHIAIIELLLNNSANIFAACKNGDTALHAACRGRHKGVVELLLKNGANIDATCKSEFSPLFIACQTGNKEIVDLLLKNGADINAGYSSGNTPIYIACSNGHRDIAELLLSKGVNINDCPDGFPPLYIACSNGHKDIVELLLEKGANMNIICKDGHTPLSIAKAYNHKDIVELLVAKRYIEDEKQASSHSAYFSA